MPINFIHLMAATQLLSMEFDQKSKIKMGLKLIQFEIDQILNLPVSLLLQCGAMGADNLRLFFISFSSHRPPWRPTAVLYLLESLIDVGSWNWLGFNVSI